MGKFPSKIALLFLLELLVLLSMDLAPSIIMCLSLPAHPHSNSTAQPPACIEEERLALLALKKSFMDPSHNLLSWKGTDCCINWKGVSCDYNVTTRTYHVVKLDLQNQSFSYLNSSAGEVISIPSLVKLKYLKHLDLSGMSFPYPIFIPQFLGHMKHLVYLNLSSSNFYGLVPQHLGNLSTLEFLDLSRNFAGLRLDDFSWVSRLSSLKHLDLGDVDLSKATGKLMQVLYQLPSLFHLSLWGCSLNNSHLFSTSNSTFLASTTIQYLDLSYNSFHGPIPDFVRNLTSLEVLDLSMNSFSSSVPLWLGNLKSLVHLYLHYNYLTSIESGLWFVLRELCFLQSLDLSVNNFHSESLTTHIENVSEATCNKYNLETMNLVSRGFRSELPDWLGKFLSLKHFLTAQNSFYGPIPSSLGRLSFLTELYLPNNQLSGAIPASLGRLSSLTDLDLSNNKLTGPIPASLGRLSFLTGLDLSNNKLTSAIPASLGRLSSLTLLDLSDNQLSGAIPVSLGQLLNLSKLNVSSNALEGVVSESHFANLSSLTVLSFESNYLIKIKVTPNWLPPFQLEFVGLSSCKFENGGFPNWIQTQQEAARLYLSNCSISGTLPLWLLQNMPNITNLDLSHNQIQGPIPNFSVNEDVRLQEAILSYNLFNSSIPNSFCNLEYLIYLDLSRNSLSGHIPNCWKDSPSLSFINLSSNKLLGVVPNSFGHLSSLEWLLLSNNNLTGLVPLALRNCTWLTALDLGGNKLSGNIPTWIGKSLTSLRILKMRSNLFNGVIPLQLCLLVELQIMDLAENGLVGRLPSCFGSLKGMMVLDSEPSTIPEFEAEAPMEEATPPTTATSSGFSGAPIASSIVDSSPYSDDEWDKASVRQFMKGRELEYTTVLKFVVNMDLSRNRLVGSIPEELTNLSGLVGLNLAHNHFSGSIPKKMGNLRSLQSLDLSQNELSRTIPETLSELTQLSYLNLSYNKLTGKIPQGNQLQTLDDPSIYEGNPQLCGAPLLERCPGNEPTTAGSGDVDEDDSDSADRLWFYLVVMIGYATGFWGVVGVLVLKKSWRRAYFVFVDETKDKVYVIVALKMGALKKSVMKKMKLANTVN